MQKIKELDVSCLSTFASRRQILSVSRLRVMCSRGELALPVAWDTADTFDTAVSKFNIYISYVCTKGIPLWGTAVVLNFNFHVVRVHYLLALRLQRALVTIIYQPNDKQRGVAQYRDTYQLGGTPRAIVRRSSMRFLRKVVLLSFPAIVAVSTL